jgi:GNAT superfamily N-acetyltransferase
MTLSIRKATSTDAAVIAGLVRDLAEYEKLLDEARATPADFARELDAPNPVISVLIAEWEGKPAGFALYFFNFSTFVGRQGLYLEDLFVKPELRGHGIGRQLLRELAKIAKSKDCGRMEWAVLDWNEPALGFYQTLDARVMNEWLVHRLTRPEIAKLAAED